MNKIPKLIGVELFAGAGGMSVGARQAGVDIKLAVEFDKAAANTYCRNHPDTKVLTSDVRTIDAIGIRKGKTPTVLFGGPPCQGFSLSNQKTRNAENENNWLFKDFIRLAKGWQPDWIVIENVSGLVKTEQGYFLDKILRALKRAGFTTSHALLNAAEYGVPQKRERLFIVGSLHGTKFEFPEATTCNHITVKEALSDLPHLCNGASIPKMNYREVAEFAYAKKLRKNKKLSLNNEVTRNNDLVISRYEHIPQGGNWSDIPARLMQNYQDRMRCHGGIYHRLDENRPSVVIGNYRKNMLIHPNENRGLSVREAARLQSFPDSFEFYGALVEKQQQVGNAVPPLLAKSVFTQLVKY